MYDATQGPFWAGGSAQGWFVNFHEEQSVYPGSSHERRIRWFDSRDWGGEDGAAKQAEALALNLNAAILGAPLMDTLRGARLAFHYAADCMDMCGDKHAHGKEYCLDWRDRITDALRLGGEKV